MSRCHEHRFMSSQTLCSRQLLCVFSAHELLALGMDDGGDGPIQGGNGT